MIRLMGILTGSAMAVGLLILAVGVPEFNATHNGDNEQVDPVIPEATVQIMEADAISEIEPVVDQTEHDVDVAEAPPPDLSPSAIPDPMPDPLPDIAPKPVASDPAPAPPAERQWYAFWSPFRSQIAADGFVAQLQRTTGLDYRVIKLKPGVFEVAFAYSDDSDIQNKLSQISTATGLDLSDG